MSATDETTPGFLQGTEVARANPMEQPGFELQLPLLEQEPEVRKKLMVALLVVFGVFLAGMAAGAVVGIFI